MVADAELVKMISSREELGRETKDKKIGQGKYRPAKDVEGDLILVTKRCFRLGS